MRNLLIVFYSGCTSLHSCQQCMRISFSPHPCQYLLFLVFLTVAILAGVRHYLTVVFMCIFLWLATLNIFYVFVGHVYGFFGKMSIQILSFLNWIVCFLYWVLWVLYIFWILIPYWIYDLQYLLLFSRLPFCFVDGSFAVQKLFNLM